jgi:Ni,Fe-hydrogenase I large subunit
LKKIKKLPPLRLANCVYKKILDRLENKDENYDLYLSALDQIAMSFKVNKKLLEIREEHSLSPESKQHIPTPTTTTITPESTSSILSPPTLPDIPKTITLPDISKTITRPDSKHKPTPTPITSNPDLQRKQQSILRGKILSWLLFWKNQQQMIKSATPADLKVYSKRLIQYNPTTQKARNLKQYLLKMISKEQGRYTDITM